MGEKRAEKRRLTEGGIDPVSGPVLSCSPLTNTAPPKNAHKGIVSSCACMCKRERVCVCMCECV